MGEISWDIWWRASHQHGHGNRYYMAKCGHPPVGPIDLCAVVPMWLAELYSQQIQVAMGPSPVLSYLLYPFHGHTGADVLWGCQPSGSHQHSVHSHKDPTKETRILCHRRQFRGISSSASFSCASDSSCPPAPNSCPVERLASASREKACSADRPWDIGSELSQRRQQPRSITDVFCCSTPPATWQAGAGLPRGNSTPMEAGAPSSRLPRCSPWDARPASTRL